MVNEVVDNMIYLGKMGLPDKGTSQILTLFHTDSYNNLTQELGNDLRGTALSHEFDLCSFFVLFCINVMRTTHNFRSRSKRHNTLKTGSDLGGDN